MNDKVIGKYLSKIGNNRGEVVASDPEFDNDEDFGAFGILRGGQRDRCAMLELRKKGGDSLAIGYAWMERIEYVPGTITLHLPDNQVKIRGSNLNSEARSLPRLYQSLTRHKVAWVQEATRGAILESERHLAIVDAVEW